MDYPTPEEDGDLLASDPLDVVEHVLLAETLAFDRTDYGDLAFALTGAKSPAEAMKACLFETAGTA